MNPGDSIVWDPILPTQVLVLLVLCLGCLTFAVYWRVGRGLDMGERVSLLLLRLVGLGLICLLLWQPSISRPTPPPVRDLVTLVGVDTSKSMLQRDVRAATRLDAAKQMLIEAGICDSGGKLASSRLRLFTIGEESTWVTDSVLKLDAQAPTTRIHSAVQGALQSLSATEHAVGMVLFTDGHDFELVHPAKTASIAKNKRVPIYAIPLGNQGKVRDVSLHIVSYAPYCYAKQKARVSASLRVVGCEFETLRVQLLRQGVRVESRSVATTDQMEIPVDFEVTEQEVGQFEYEVRVDPVEQETDLLNNAAITYLNVIDQRLPILILEGAPYWDTTFLQRSLMRNDKFDVDALVEYAEGRVRPIRKEPKHGDLLLPETAAEFRKYDVVILGRSVERLMKRAQLDELHRYVEDLGGTVVFSRGPAFAGDLAKNELEPVLWGDLQKNRVKMSVARESQSLAPFRGLRDADGGLLELPESLFARTAQELRPLSGTLATAAGPEQSSPVPGLVHRRVGQGQVVSFGVEGLWHWAFNPKVDGPNSAFDRFWDQLVLWLQASRDFVPSKQYSFRPSTATLQLGDKIYFRLGMRDPDAKLRQLPFSVYRDNQEVARLSMMQRSGGAPGHLMAEYTPDKRGRYEVRAQFPDGTRQESRFMVTEEHLEETEVASDRGYLQRLCEGSGGRILEPSDLAKLIRQWGEEKLDAAPKRELIPVWDAAWVYYLIGLILGLDWYLRRRWGLC